MREFGVGAVVGLVTSIVAVETGTLGFVLVAVVILVGALRRPRFAALAGILVALGAAWSFLAVQSIDACARTEDFCGHANIVPFSAAGLGLLAAGLLVAIHTHAVRSRA